MRGYKQGKVDLVEQYDNYYNQVKRLQKDDEYLAKIKRMTKKSVGKKHKEGYQSFKENPSYILDKSKNTNKCQVLIQRSKSLITM